MMLWYGIVSFTCAVVMTGIVKFFALQFGITDNPEGGRKIHKKPIALLGGVSVMLAFFSIILLAYVNVPLVQHIPNNRIFGVLWGSLVLLGFGIWDDVKKISASLQFAAIVIASLIVVISGIRLDVITNPLGGFFFIPPLIGVLGVVIWLITISLTTKLLDGLDGLVTGMTAIGALVIAIFSLFTKYYQPEIALIAFILAGVCFGFLIWNMHPASIFLGNVGSVWLGFMLGVLAVIAGGKLAIALLVLGLPMIDMVVVIVRRLIRGRKPWEGDATHLHHALLHRGWSQRTIVYLYWSIAAAFGGLTIFLQSSGKLSAFTLLFALSIFLIFAASHYQRTSNA